MPGAVEEYGQLLQLASRLSGHLMATSSTDATAGIEQWERHSLVDAHRALNASSASWLPYLLSSHLIQGHSRGRLLQGTQEAPSAVLDFVDPEWGCDTAAAYPAEPGCGARSQQDRPRGNLTGLPYAPLVHLARRLMQQQLQGQSAGCTASLSFSSEGNSSGAGTAVLPGEVYGSSGAGTRCCQERVGQVIAHHSWCSPVIAWCLGDRCLRNLSPASGGVSVQPQGGGV